MRSTQTRYPTLHLIPPPANYLDVPHKTVFLRNKLKFRVPRSWHAELIPQTSASYKPSSTVIAATQMATFEAFIFPQTLCLLITSSLYNTSCQRTYYHLRPDFVYLSKGLLYLSTKRQRRFLPHVPNTRKTNAQTAVYARLKIDSVWGLHKVTKWNLVASTPVAQKNDSCQVSYL